MKKKRFVRLRDELTVKKHSVTKNFSDLSLFGKIVLVISKNFKFSAFNLKFQSFSGSLTQYFLTIGQNYFGNKIPVDDFV